MGCDNEPDFTPDPYLVWIARVAEQRIGRKTWWPIYNFKRKNLFIPLQTEQMSTAKFAL